MDTRLTTGYNLRFIMILSGLNTIDELKSGKADFEYHTVEKKMHGEFSLLRNWLMSDMEI